MGGNIGQSKILRRHEHKMQIIALVTDAFGGHGGIAQYNRDVLTAFCLHPAVRRVVAIPRLLPSPAEPIPDQLIFDTKGTEGPFHYIRAVIRNATKYRHWDLIFCGHINLVPLAVLLGWILRKPVLLQIHGIDAWTPPARMLSARLANKVDAVLSVSNFTLDRFFDTSAAWRGN